MFRFVIFVSNYPGEPRVAAVTWLCTHLSLLGIMLHCYVASVLQRRPYVVRSSKIAHYFTALTAQWPT